MTGSIYNGDQQTGQTIVVNGVHTTTTVVAAIKAVAATNSVYRFTREYTVNWNGQHCTYREGVSYPLDSALKAALLAASAPMVLQ
jgi:hypothetical protein